MFTGRYVYNLDDKGRLVIPLEYRKQLGDVVVINKGIESCITLYKNSDWDDLVEKLTNMPFNIKDNRKFNRLFLSSAFKKEFDSQGRISIDTFLKKHANIEKECIILGAGNMIEIWAKEVWDKEEASCSEDMDYICEKLTL